MALRSAAAVTECIGVAAMHTPLPAFAAEQIVAPFADAGDPMLPRQYAGPFERLQRLHNRTAGVPCPLGDRLVRREASAVPAVVEAQASVLGTRRTVTAEARASQQPDPSNLQRLTPQTEHRARTRHGYILPSLSRVRRLASRIRWAREGADRPKGAKGQRTVAVEQAMRVVAEKSRTMRLLSPSPPQASEPLELAPGSFDDVD